MTCAGRTRSPRDVRQMPAVSRKSRTAMAVGPSQRSVGGIRDPEAPMTTIRKELRRLQHAFVWSGVAMFALGLAAVIWPEDILILAMIAVGVVATLVGLYELTIALSIVRRAPAWGLILIHGATVLLFGALTAGAPGLRLRLALTLIAGWMLLYAWLAATVAILIWNTRSARWALLIWAAIDVVLALVSVFYPEATIFALLYFGAAYAAAFGAWQLAAGLWIRLQLSDANRRFAWRRFAAARP